MSSADKSPTLRRSRLAYPLAAAGACALLYAIFAAMVAWLRTDLLEQIHLRIVERDAAVLYPMALQQLAEAPVSSNAELPGPLSALLQSAHQKGMLAVDVFDRSGEAIDSIPSTQLLVELPPEDYIKLQKGSPISRYHPLFPLDQYFAGAAPSRVPVLEVLLPLPGAKAGEFRGFVRYYIDARPLSAELRSIDGRISRLTAMTLGVGGFLIAVVVVAATLAVRKAQRAVALQNERLVRANFELTLAAKASAVGQITSHLIHGLQGSVEGLKAAVGPSRGTQAHPDWESAAAYTDRLQTMIRDVIALLGDIGASASYELSGDDLKDMLRQRAASLAQGQGVGLVVDGGFGAPIDSHLGSILCLIASNLIQNALQASEPGKEVTVALSRTVIGVILTVRDEGPGIPEEVQKHLFKPGRSGREGGSGLGLAISKLLARNIGAEIVLLTTGPTGTTFRVTLPEPD
jgi:signal transduction histidine kinase